MLEIIQKIIFEVTGKSEVTIDTDFGAGFGVEFV